MAKKKAKEKEKPRERRDYVWIRRYSMAMNWSVELMIGLQTKAVEEGAALDVICFDEGDGVWLTTADVKDEKIRGKLGLDLVEYRCPACGGDTAVCRLCQETYPISTGLFLCGLATCLEIAGGLHCAGESCGLAISLSGKGVVEEDSFQLWTEVVPQAPSVGETT